MAVTTLTTRTINAAMTTPIARRGLEVAAVRDHFPALARELHGRPIVYLDGAAGSQVPRQTIDAVAEYLEHHNANRGGPFVTARETDAMVAEVRQATADFLGAHAPEEVVFGPNMTTLTFALSRALGRELKPGDELVLTRLDHDANVAPWVAVAEERGAKVRWIDVRTEDCTLQLDQVESLIGERTRLVAVGMASNAVGTLNDVGRVIEVAHAFGALVFVDAVHAAPHMPIDAAGLRADFLACSPYKFFAPHLGVLYGRRELLERLPAYRTRPAGDALPGKWEPGSQPHELLAGLLGTFEYLGQLGRAYGGASAQDDRRATLRAAMSAIRSYERDLTGPLLDGLASVRGLTVHGIAEPSRAAERLPTVAIGLPGQSPAAVARHLADAGINAWHGTMYTPDLMRALGLDDAGGVVRIGLLHYNTADEIELLVDSLGELAGRSTGGITLSAP
jgi:cysteine desulfurase family protein (TIGR01976 family)